MVILCNYYKKKRIRRVKSIIRIVLIVILFLALAFSGYKIVDWFISNNNEIILNDVSDYIDISDVNGGKSYDVNFDKLKSINSDTVAWVKLNNTNIEYVVVKGSDNEYYLNHNFDRKRNSSGWIFADYRNSFDSNDLNIIIYGHDTKNGSMFGSLKNILNSGWYNNVDNRFVILATEYGIHKYEVFSVYEEEGGYPISTRFTSGAEYEEFLYALKSKSIKDFGVDLDSTKGILTLSTCANNGSIVLLHAIKSD